MGGTRLALGSIEPEGPRGLTLARGKNASSTHCWAVLGDGGACGASAPVSSLEMAAKLLSAGSHDSWLTLAGELLVQTPESPSVDWLWLWLWLCCWWWW